jgi:hypothetical protein
MCWNASSGSLLLMISATEEIAAAMTSAATGATSCGTSFATSIRRDPTAPVMRPPLRSGRTTSELCP